MGLTFSTSIESGAMSGETDLVHVPHDLQNSKTRMGTTLTNDTLALLLAEGSGKSHTRATAFKCFVHVNVYNVSILLLTKRYGEPIRAGWVVPENEGVLVNVNRIKAHMF